MITHSFWQRRFAGDSAIVGRQVVIGDQLFTVVGVAAPEFRGSVMMWAPDVFIPFAMAPVITGQRLDDFGGSFYATARLRDGVPAPTAAAELTTLMLDASPDGDVVVFIEPDDPLIVSGTLDHIRDALNSGVVLNQ